MGIGNFFPSHDFTDGFFMGSSKNSGFKFLPLLVFSVSVAFHLLPVSFCQVSSVT